MSRKHRIVSCTWSCRCLWNFPCLHSLWEILSRLETFARQREQVYRAKELVVESFHCHEGLNKGMQSLRNMYKAAIILLFISCFWLAAAVWWELAIIVWYLLNYIMISYLVCLNDGLDRLFLVAYLVGFGFQYWANVFVNLKK